MRWTVDGPAGRSTHRVHVASALPTELPDFGIVCYFSSFTYAAGSKRALLLNHLLFSPTNCFAIFPQTRGSYRQMYTYRWHAVSNARSSSNFDLFANHLFAFVIVRTSMQISS